jgi:hypothetical protein
MALVPLLYLTQAFIYITQLGAERLINTGQAIYHYTNGTVIRISLFKAGYGPGGVLTSFHKFLEISDIVVYTFLLGSGLAFTFLAYLLYGGAGAGARAREGEGEDADGTDSSEEGWETDSEEIEEEEEVKYETQYFKQLEDLPVKELSLEELAVISTNVLMEETPKGMVYMSYNAEMQTFDYYTDKFVDVTYEILDTVARLFAITFLCKQVCVNYKEEVQKGEKNMLSEIEFDKLKKELDERNLINANNKERSVFASFKSYNKKNGNNVEKKYYIVTEKANRFKYKGKISDYEKKQKNAADTDTKPNCINISYSEFKRLQTQEKVSEQVNVHLQVEELTQL